MFGHVLLPPYEKDLPQFMPYHFYEMDSFEREDLAAMPVPVGIEQLQALVRYVLMNARCRCRAHLCTY